MAKNILKKALGKYIEHRWISFFVFFGMSVVVLILYSLFESTLEFSIYSFFNSFYLLLLILSGIPLVIAFSKWILTKEKTHNAIKNTVDDAVEGVSDFFSGLFRLVFMVVLIIFVLYFIIKLIKWLWIIA